MAQGGRRFVRLFVVRHGEVEANRSFRHVGAQDDPLTRRGEAQAKELGARLSSVSLAAIYASPLLRTRQTAERIARATDLEVRVEARLAERSYGAWEGLSRDEIGQRSASDRELLARDVTDLDAAPPGGESFRSVAARVTELMSELVVAHTGESIVLVSHVGPIKVLLAAALDLALAQVQGLFLDPGTLSVIDWGEPSYLRLFNDHSHQGWQNARWLEGR